MLEGQWYSVDYDAFVALLGFSDDDLQKDRIHIEQVLPPEQLAYMYPPRGERGVVGKVLGLHPTYRYLDRMFRKTIDCKGGDKEILQITPGTCSIGWHLMHDPSVYLTSFGARSGVSARGPSRAVVLLPTSCT